MERAQEILKKYFRGNLGINNREQSPQCLDENTLAAYLAGTLDRRQCQLLEYHLAGCGFCLSQLSLAVEAVSLENEKDSIDIPSKTIDRLKLRLAINPLKDSQKKYKFKIGKGIFFLIGTLISFSLSFIFPRFFLQFLVATLILGIRWAFESESGHTFVMILDSWRRNAREKKESTHSRKKPL